MTGILTRRTNEPTSCMICQGQASAIGVCKTNNKGYALPPFDGWTCVQCVAAAKELIKMNANDIGLIEKNAIDTVAKGCLDNGIQVFLGALFDAGVDKLSEATGDQISLAKDSLIVNGEAHSFVTSVVLSFGDEVKAAVERGDAPF